MKYIRIAFVAWALSMAMGCAVGNKYALETAPLAAPTKGSGRVAVSAHDQRTEVAGSGRSPNVLGVQRAGFGNPWEVTTESGHPLATVVATSMARALTAAGFKVGIVPATPSASPSEVSSAALAKGGDKAVVVTVHAFWSDTYNNVGLTYDISLTVLDRSGRVLAQSRAKHEKELLGGNFFNPPAHAKKVVPQAYARILSALLQDPNVAKALALPVGNAAQDDPSS